MTRPLPLEGFRILAVEQYGACPYGTMLLAQLGAEVIKIEPPRVGDTARAVGPHFLAEGESLYFQAFNLNKKSLTLDLKLPEGRKIFERLAADADAVANNLRGDLPERLGLTYAALESVNPAIVCAHLSAYGRDNSRTAWPGYDYLMQAEAGFLSLTGEPDAPPARFGLSMVDFMTGTMMAIGLLAALLDAEQTGIGRDVDTDLLSTAVHQTTYPAVWYLNEGDMATRTPRSSHPSVTPSQMFRAADGWIFVMAQLPKFWAILLDKLGRADLAEDPRFATAADRLAHRTSLTAILDGIFETEPAAHWVALLGGHVPVARVNDLGQALDSEELLSTGMIAEIDHPYRPAMRVLASPIKVDGERLPNRPGPILGSDNAELLARAGFTEADIQDFASRGVV